jgi:hypothetical protein
MRNITKIFLLLVFAFVVYLLWPRTPSLKGFDPVALAKLDVSNWQAQKANKGMGALVARYKIFTSQYQFAPISAFRIAQNQAAALAHLKLALQEGSAGEVEEKRTLLLLGEKYTWIREQTKADLDPDTLAREEFAWRSQELNGATVEETATSLAGLLASLYGGAAEDYNEVATNLVNARAIIFKDAAPADGTSPATAAQTTASDAYKLLKEIAQTPPSAPAQ